LTKLTCLNISNNPPLKYPNEILISTDPKVIFKFIKEQTVKPPQAQTDVVAALQKSSTQQVVSTNSLTTQKRHRRIFISYCWKNSKQAEQLQQVMTCVGRTDPRDIAVQLEIRMQEKCWLDVDVANGGHALFSAIAVGIEQSEVVVACLSDEYAKSDTCEDEVTYARKKNARSTSYP